MQRLRSFSGPHSSRLRLSCSRRQPQAANGYCGALRSFQERRRLLATRTVAACGSHAPCPPPGLRLGGLPVVRLRQWPNSQWSNSQWSKSQRSNSFSGQTPSGQTPSVVRLPVVKLCHSSRALSSHGGGHALVSGTGADARSMTTRAGLPSESSRPSPLLSSVAPGSVHGCVSACSRVQMVWGRGGEGKEACEQGEWGSEGARGVCS